MCWRKCLVILCGSVSVYGVQPHSQYRPPEYQPKHTHGKDSENKYLGRQYRPRSWPEEPRKWFPNQGRVSNNIQGQGPNFGSRRQRDVDDRKIYLEIRHFLSGRNIGISVNQGNVTIWGAVNSQEEKSSIENEISDMAGVRNITNQLSVANTKIMRRRTISRFSQRKY